MKFRMLFIISSTVQLFGVAGFNSAQAVTDSPFGNDSDKPINITADSLEVDDKSKLAVFRGNVNAVQGTVDLKADVMKVYYSPDASNSGKEGESAQKISKIITEGNVKIISEGQSASSKFGNYDVTKSLITMTGDVVLRKDQNVLNGQKFEYDLQTGKSRLISPAPSSTAGAQQNEKGRVKALFIPEK